MQRNIKFDINVIKHGPESMNQAVSRIYCELSGFFFLVAKEESPKEKKEEKKKIKTKSGKIDVAIQQP